MRHVDDISRYLWYIMFGILSAYVIKSWLLSVVVSGPENSRSCLLCSGLNKLFSLIIQSKRRELSMILLRQREVFLQAFA